MLKSTDEFPGLTLAGISPKMTCAMYHAERKIPYYGIKDCFGENNLFKTFFKKKKNTHYAEIKKKLFGLVLI